MTRSLSLFIMWACFASSVVVAQSDTLDWKDFAKDHKIVEIVNDAYIDRFWTSISTTPFIFLDTLFVVARKSSGLTVRPLHGMEAFADSFTFPEIARRAGLSGNVGLTATLDKTGKTKNIRVRWSNAQLFNQSASLALERSEFYPVLLNGQPIEVEIAISVSFALKTKRNLRIEQITIDMSPCLGSCPAYSITLYEEGEVTYEGKYNVPRMGKWHTTMDKRSFYGITSLLYAMRFFDMKESYSTGATDLPWITISTKSENGFKRVTSDYYYPLWEIAVLVDHVTEKSTWQKVTE